MKVVVASKNPVKIASAKEALENMWPEKAFEVLGASVPSGVADQPIGDEETLLGARNRAKAAVVAEPSADLYIGIEGGIMAQDGGYMTAAWIAVYDGKREGSARSAAFHLPPEVCRLLDTGLELGDADDQVFGSSNSKQAGGALGLLTDNKLTRTGLYVPAVMMALIPFLKKELYQL